ncbi:PE-PPE domain-containing protein [Candidatus Mycobacterium wuenschmannii]|uniref:PE-PPE domain-containing protein n=1 Tax=Candidatus Mycobacterium wuenschmannii TaxID=3027808 RepID=A0ABY8W212_9MYCO|nr:PE-PPE domain-containing protein [Candidatus Mycobacterium wuenschmannii]WIM88477.1 PE-PPE domain-containing protein [Candidatus Mycobacterium wuenschmannii]
MKKTILAAALCGVAIAFSGTAKADSSNDWLSGLTAIDNWFAEMAAASSTNNWLTALIGLENLFNPGNGSLPDPVGGGDGAEFLSGSTHALVLGATGVSTPSANYVSDALNLYLEPNGYDGNFDSALALTTPETFSFDSSVSQGEQILINTIVADYNAGDMGCNAAGICSDPLTIFTYSQSSLIASLAEQQLSADKIPDDALRFVMLGANPLGAPNDLFPTMIYDINGDTWAQPGSLGTSWQDLLTGMVLHEVYLGLTPSEIASASTVTDGMTILHELPTLTGTAFWDALIGAFGAGAS